MKDNYKQELLALLKLFKGDEVLDFSYEQEGDKWSLFIHISRGVIQISGDRGTPLRKTVYTSPIIDTIPWRKK